MDEIDNETKLDTRRVVKISRVKFIITTIIMIIVIIVGFLWYSSTRILYNTSSGVSTQSDSSLGSESTKSKSDVYYPEYQQQPSISDTREFLKTSFSATIKTRDVQEVVTDVKNIIKGADGRIDNLYSSEKSGSISFVVAKSKFDAFKGEIEALTHKKLYTESISSQNLLSQKQNIEEQTNNIVNTLADLNKQKEALTTKHNQTVNSISNELSRIQTELVLLKSEQIFPIRPTPKS